MGRTDEREPVRRALLTGVTGFVGSRLAGSLLSAGWEVHAVVREKSRTERLPESLRRQVAFHVLDSRQDLPGILRRAAPDVVMHLASLFLARHRYEDIAALVESNVLFGTRLLDAMAENGICRLVNAGTSWQHYEGRVYSPVNLYAASKQAFEDMMRYYVEAKGLKAISLHLFDTYGEGDPRRKLLALFQEHAGTGQCLSMSPGEQKIDLVHVDDVAEAFRLAGQYLADGRYELCGTYAVTSGQAVTLRELACRYERWSGKRLEIGWGDLPYRPREVMEPWHGGKLLPGWHRCHTELM